MMAANARRIARLEGSGPKATGRAVFLTVEASVWRALDPDRREAMIAANAAPPPQPGESIFPVVFLIVDPPAHNVPPH